MSSRAPKGERTPARPGAEQEAFLAVLKTADALTTELAELLKPHAVSPTQYNVLRILRGAGGGGGEPGSSAAGLTCGQIAGRMLTHDPDMTRLLDRLEARGLIARGRDTDDRRRVSSRITPDGLALVDLLDRPVLDLHHKQFGRLGEKKLAALLGSLAGVKERCADPSVE